MDRAYFPFLLFVSPALRKALGTNLQLAANNIVHAMLEHGRGREIAHQQLSFGKVEVAFSARVGKWGDLIVEMDLSTPALRDRRFFERELRSAEAAFAARRRR